MNVWHTVSNPIKPSEHIPAERKTVLVWLKEKALPFCGYIRYAAGDEDCPYFVVYHGNSRIGSDVVAWCDCLPNRGPDFPSADMYSKEQNKGRGFPERVSSNRDDLDELKEQANEELLEWQSALKEAHE
jgi:hypothetical protein